jgi:hypothetical protein
VTAPRLRPDLRLDIFIEIRHRLDFSYFGAKKVGYARHRNLPKEVIEVRTLPPKMVQALTPFAPLFSKRVWQNAQVLLMGAILAPGLRTVSSALRAMGLDQHKRFHRYHRVLSHASWSSVKASRVLFGVVGGDVRARGRSPDRRHRRDTRETLGQEDCLH